MTSTVDSTFRHLTRLMGPHGLFEHAEHTRPRTEHGYCTDDNARLLLVTSREDDTGASADLSRRSLAFVLAAQSPGRGAHNRLDPEGAWTDEATADDCWGRSLWSLGVAATHHGDPSVRAAAQAGFDASAPGRASSPRSAAFAALGASEVFAADPTHTGAETLLRRALSTIGPVLSPHWCWPEARLTYANAALAEAVIAAGTALGSGGDIERGLQMLDWLLQNELRFGHLSVTPAGGCAVISRDPSFDQQPIEVAALADACVRAHHVTGDRSWLDGVDAAVRWFDGENDAGHPMHDPDSGGSFDGLHAHGVNRNQGAESTLALASTHQCARRLAGSL